MTLNLTRTWNREEVENLMKMAQNQVINKILDDFKMINVILDKTKAINLYPYIEKWEGRLKQ